MPATFMPASLPEGKRQSVFAKLSAMLATSERAAEIEGGRGCFMLGKLKGEKANRRNPCKGDNGSGGD
jgi:hypothetical protein